MSSAADKQVEIFEALARLETRLESITTDQSSRYESLVNGVNDRLDHIDQRVEHINHLLMGNGTPGVLTRVDRLEQSEIRRGRLIWVTLTAAIGAVISTVVHAFR